MTYVALVRHGETDWNRRGRLQGSSDVPLNDTGRAQARAASKRLAHRPWDLVVTSPLSRAHETAEIIAEGLRLGVGATYDGLVERHFGEAEGMTDWEAYYEWPHGSYPGLEPRREVAERGLATLVALAREHPDDAIVVVTHGGVVRAVLDVVNRWPSPRILNASVSTLTIDTERTPSGDVAVTGWRVHSINDQPIAAELEFD